MKVAIMQPAYLPWIGYFKMMMETDLFIFLDDVQFEKRCFQQRNQILSNGKRHLLTVPVFSKNKFKQEIREVKINNEINWLNKHKNTIKMNYSSHPYFKDFFHVLEKIYQKKQIKLIDLNKDIILSIAQYLEINIKFDFSSNYNVNERKDKKLIEILKKVGAKKYLSPIGSKPYIGEGRTFYENEIGLEYFEYKCKEYPQKNAKTFQSHLSIIDIIFNLGKRSVIEI